MNRSKKIMVWVVILLAIAGGVAVQQLLKQGLAREAFWIVEYAESQSEKIVLLGQIIQSYEGDIRSAAAAQEIQELVKLADETVDILAVRYITVDPLESEESYISHWSEPPIKVDREADVLPIAQKGVAASMVRARNQGVITATPPIVVDEQTWFWVTVPLYGGSGVPDDPDVRRSTFSGYLQIALTYDEFIGRRFDRLVELSGIAFSLRDIDPETDAKTGITETGILRGTLENFRRVEFVDRAWYLSISAGSRMIVYLRFVWGAVGLMVLSLLWIAHGGPRVVWNRLRKRYQR